jgi:plastocyanin
MVTAMNRSFLILISGFIGLLMVPSPGTAYQEGEVANGGRLTGRVSFQGPIPEPYVIWVKKDEEVFGKTVPDERLLISKQGRVKNVVITIEGIQQGKRWPSLKSSVVNDKGRFIPHVQVVPTGAQLEIVNRDPVLHNTHGFQRKRTIFNVGLPLQGQKVKRSLKQAGIIEVMCDVHDWMNGWIVVQDHPYFAVTGDDGNFTITDVPPGSYKISAWHEKLGKKQTQITVKAGRSDNVDFAFSP